MRFRSHFTVSYLQKDTLQLYCQNNKAFHVNSSVFVSIFKHTITLEFKYGIGSFLSIQTRRIFTLLPNEEQLFLAQLARKYQYIQDFGQG